jgi:2,3-bisphosphoglycerate-independent phosphoglycerate mutase
MPAPTLFIFLDGVGLGEDDPATNPFLSARLPWLREGLGLPALTRGGVPFHGERASLVGLDASLGVAGTPQSGTGQTALLTGRNAAAMFGRHFGPWVPTELRALLSLDSVLMRARGAGLDVAFANAYPEELVALASQTAPMAPGAAAKPHRRLPTFLRAGPPIAALGAGLMTRHTDALERGDAVASEITNDGWRERLHRTSLPIITAEEAGRTLATIASRHDLTFFAHYTTDYVGHEMEMAGAVHALETVDGFLRGVMQALPADALLVVASDHGNVEDITRGHTMNPALCLVSGPAHAAFARELRDLCDVTPALLRRLGVPERPEGTSDSTE